MNGTLESIVRTHVPEVGSTGLSFVKFNTAGSPLRAYPKVLFFCFEGGRQEPSWCLKTVRAAANNGVISKGFANLETLNRLAGDGRLFARPIWIGEVDGIAWSVEEAAPGRRPIVADIPRVIDAYISFQKVAGSPKMVPVKEKAEALLRELDLSDAEQTEIRRACDTFCRGDITLAPQHGDFTPDNVLIDGLRVTLIDCDSFMPEGIAGFDLFHFLSRVPHAPGIREYLHVYRQGIGMAREFDAGDLLVWILQERALKKAQGAPRELEPLVSTFERFRKTFGV